MTNPSEYGLLSLMQRPIDICRSWLFVEGANEQALHQAATSQADVLIQELEDFTPTEFLPKARALAPETYQRWRQAGAIIAVRINPLAGDGKDDLPAVMHARPDIVALPKVAGPQDIIDLDEAITGYEQEYGITPGSTAVLPNIESAQALVQTGKIATASKRVIACLLASEDLAADIGAERLHDCTELSYARQRFLIECTAVGVLAVDCPYTWSDIDGLNTDTLWARRHGYKAKSAVALDHAREINKTLTPTTKQITEAQNLIAAYETARQKGNARAHHNGALIETPKVTAAHRLLDRANKLSKHVEDEDIG